MALTIKGSAANQLIGRQQIAVAKHYIK